MFSNNFHYKIMLRAKASGDVVAINSDPIFLFMALASVAHAIKCFYARAYFILGEHENIKLCNGPEN